MFKVGDEAYVVVSGKALRGVRILEQDDKGRDRYWTDWGCWYIGKELVLKNIYDSPLYNVMKEEDE